MTKCFKHAAWALLAIFMLTATCGAVLAAETMTVVGTVNDEGALVDADGTIYLLGEGEMDDEVAQLIGQKVEAKGSVTKNDDSSQTITIKKYKALEE